MKPILKVKIAVDAAMTAAMLLLMAYGVIAFVRREVGLYLLLKSHFVFFDYSEPLILFLLDYLAVMGLFVCIGYGLSCISTPSRAQ